MEINGKTPNCNIHTLTSSRQSVQYNNNMT